MVDATDEKVRSTYSPHCFFNSLLNGRQMPAANTMLRAHLKLNCPLDFKNAYLWNVLIYEGR
jgi:hypothetical protein